MNEQDDAKTPLPSFGDAAWWDVVTSSRTSASRLTMPAECSVTFTLSMTTLSDGSIQSSIILPVSAARQTSITVPVSASTGEEGDEGGEVGERRRPPTGQRRRRRRRGGGGGGMMRTRQIARGKKRRVSDTESESFSDSEDEQGVVKTSPLSPSGTPTNQAPPTTTRRMIDGFDGYNRRVIDARPGHERFGYAPPDSPPARQLRSILASTSLAPVIPATTTTQAGVEGPVQRFCWNNQSLPRPVVPAKGDICAFNIIDVYNIV